MGVLAALCTSLSLAQSGAVANALRADVEALRSEQAHIADLQRQIGARLRTIEAQLGAMEAIPLGRSADKVEGNAPGDSNTTPRLNVFGDLRLRTQGDYFDDSRRDGTSAQVRALLEKGLLTSESYRAPLRLGFPIDVVERWCPWLYPVAT